MAKIMMGNVDAGAQLYTDTLAGYNAREAAYQGNYANNIAGYERLYANQAAFGDSERIRIEQENARNLAASQASMISRGLGNTTALDSAARGINYDTQNQYIALNDQRLQRQNQIAQNELGYMAQYQQGLAGLQGDRLGWMGSVQANSQNQNFQGAMQDEQNRYQQGAAATNFGYQQDAARQGFQYQQALAQQGFNNQVNYQNQFGYYGSGGKVGGPMGAGDVVPARLTPGEFVLSNEMIAALKQGRLTAPDIVRMIDQPAPPPPMGGYAHGGFVPKTVPSDYLVAQAAAEREQFKGGMYVPRGRYG